MRKYFIFVWLLVDLFVGNADNKGYPMLLKRNKYSLYWLYLSILSVKNCNTEEIYRSSCPSSAKCVEHKPGTVHGVCQCRDEDYAFNPKYTSNEDYCTINNIKQIRRNNSNIGGEISGPQEEKLESIAQPHHIVAGVIISIVIVFFVIGLVMAFKKLHIIRHVRLTHRSPFYEDVILGTSDHDDPPLI